MIDHIRLIHYAHADCRPLQCITRLEKHEAFELANQMAAAHKGVTAFYRFADFENYYELRVRTEAWLAGEFQSKGGQIDRAPPLYFVVQGSDYLDAWFGKGRTFRCTVGDLGSRRVSFTIGDSASCVGRGEAQGVLTARELQERLAPYGYSAEAYLKQNHPKYHYIEAQAWIDRAPEALTESV